MIRVGCPVEAGAQRGRSLMLAASKLCAFELHEQALRAVESGCSYNAYVDTVVSVFEGFFLMHGRECDGMGQLFLVGDVAMPPGCVAEAIECVGHFAHELRVVSSRPRAECPVGTLQPSHVQDLAEELGVPLPRGWVESMRALLTKHAPAPVVSPVETMDAVEAMEESYAHGRCVCGNYAGGDGVCNACRIGEAGRECDGADLVV